MCADCIVTKGELDAFTSKFPKYRIERMDISNEKNMETFVNLAAAFEISNEDTIVPTIFFSGGFLINHNITQKMLAEVRDHIKGEFTAEVAQGLVASQ